MSTRSQTAVADVVVTACVVLLVGNSVYPSLFDNAFIAGIMLLATVALLVVRRQTSSGKASTHGQLDMAFVAMAAMSANQVLFHGFGFERLIVRMAGAVALAIAAIASIAIGVSLATPLLRSKTTRPAGIAVAVGIWGVVAALLLISLPSDPRNTPGRLALLFVAGVGMLLWAGAVTSTRRGSHRGVIDAGALLLHVTGLGHMAVILYVHATQNWGLELPASIAVLAILAVGSRWADESATTSTGLSNRYVRMGTMAAPTLALVAPATGWVQMHASEAPWLASAMTALCIGLAGCLAGVVGFCRAKGNGMVTPANVANTDLRLHFQPIVRVSDGEVIGAESLLRVVDSNGDDMPAPDLVEQLGQSPHHDHVTRFVLTETFRQGTSLLGAMTDPEAFVSLNLSPDELAQSGLVERIEDALQTSECSPNGFAIEVTEEAMAAGNANDLIESLESLQQLGFLVILDDFGTGRSNLVALCDFEFDIVKIDRTLLDASHTSRGDQVLHRAIGLATAMGARVVVEGVEDDEHHRALRRHRPDFAQGFSYSAPSPMLDVLYELGPTSRRQVN